MSGIWARPFSTPKLPKLQIGPGPNYGPNPIAETIRFSAVFYLLTLFLDLVGDN